jgi:glycerol-3-phosphate dehydrogenase
VSSALVRESIAKGRNGLLRIAHYVKKPLRTTIPIFSTFSGKNTPLAPCGSSRTKRGKPKERRTRLVRVGLTAYDSFSRDGGAVPTTPIPQA